MERLFAFENQAAGGLACIPMAMRRRLDLAGVKLSLPQWVALPLELRSDLAFGPFKAGDNSWRQRLVDAILASTVEEARTLLPEPPPPWMKTDSVPAEVAEKAHALGCPLDARTWSRLDELQRFALVKLSRPGHENRNFPAALAEFGVTP